MSKDRRVIIIGLDGATFDLIIPWIEEGKLKTFKRLLQEGSYGILKSVLPPYSASAWSSFMTGKNPGKHGVVDFHYVGEGSYELSFVSSRTRVGASFWQIAGEHGYKVGVINVPITYPPDRVNGFMISGLGAPGFVEKAVHPPELYNELRQEVGEYIFKIPIRDYIRRNRLIDCKDLLIKQLKARYQYIQYLMKNKPWDILVAVFSETDHVQHYFWKYMDSSHPLYDPKDAKKAKNAIYDIYSLLDSYLSEIMKEMKDDTNLLIMSDHGAKPNSNKGVYLNNWLHQEGFLKFLDSHNGERDDFTLSKRLVLLGKRYIPSSLKLRLKSIPFLKSRIENISRYQNINWAESVAYADPHRDTVRINLKGREPAGIVYSSEYNKIREEIVQRLKQLRDPETNEIIFSEIFQREEIFWGPYTNRAPDIVCLQTGRKYLYSVSYFANSAYRHKKPIKAYSLGELSHDPSPNAAHSPEGIIIAWGENFKNGNKINGAKISDIAPTVLYLMGLPIPSDMDGKVLRDILKDSFLQENKMNFTEVKPQDTPVKGESGYTKGEEEEFKNALKDLGYF